MTKYQLFLVGCFVLGFLMSAYTDYSFLTDWEPWVLSAPYCILGAITT